MLTVADDRRSQWGLELVVVLAARFDIAMAQPGHDVLAEHRDAFAQFVEIAAAGAGRPGARGSYLAELDAAGVQAVGLGLGADLPHQRAPVRLVTAADEIGMPLLTVPDPVPFIAVTKAVFAYRARVERRELEWALQTQRALTAAAVTPGGLLGILAAHREATGRTGVAVTPSRSGAGRVGSGR